MDLPVLGIGLTYFSGLEPLLASHGDLVDVVEVEPQTLWTLTADGGLRVDRETVDRLAAFPSPKLLHGIGFPVGGVRPPDPRQVPPLREMIEALGPPWMSEHLNFNQAAGPDGRFQCGLLLPPRQTPGGVAAAAASITAMAGALPLPLAVETGVNYLAPRRDEMNDGAFVAAVVERADCGILLDLHNLWTNQRNGRQTIEGFLAEIPLERVWEIHLAGGFEHRGYWLDSHSGAVPDPLLDFAERLIPRLPGLRAVIFELFPGYLAKVGLDLVRVQLERLHGVWETRGAGTAAATAPTGGNGATEVIHLSSERPAEPSQVSGRPAEPSAGAEAPSPADWEDALAALVIGRDPDGALARELAADPGIDVMRDLLGEFRASMAASTLKLTCRLLMLSLGTPRFRQLLAAYWRETPPALFASQEAQTLARFLERSLPELGAEVPWLEGVLTFERAVLDTLLAGEGRVVSFPWDPVPVLRGLAEGRLQDAELVRAGAFEIELTPESAGGAADAAALAAPQVLH
jgi:uncharacterized protein